MNLARRARPRATLRADRRSSPPLQCTDAERYAFGTYRDCIDHFDPAHTLCVVADGAEVFLPLAIDDAHAAAVNRCEDERHRLCTRGTRIAHRVRDRRVANRIAFQEVIGALPLSSAKEDL